MAYYNQQRKKEVAPKIKALCKRYGVKGSLSVQRHSTVVLTVRSGNIDFAGDAITDDRRCVAWRGYVQVNPYWLSDNWQGKALKFLTDAKEILNEGNHDRSDVMTDYVDVGRYVDINIGQWDKPYQYTGQPVAVEGKVLA